jgi:hypothetical protein
MLHGQSSNCRRLACLIAIEFADMTRLKKREDLSTVDRSLTTAKLM